MKIKPLTEETSLDFLMSALIEMEVNLLKKSSLKTPAIELI